MLFQFFVTVLIAVVIFGFIIFIRWNVLTPVVLSKNQRVTLILTVTGKAEQLPLTVESLEWMKCSGFLPMDIIIADGGMDDETHELALRAERQRGSVSLCSLEEAGEKLKEIL